MALPTPALEPARQPVRLVIVDADRRVRQSLAELCDLETELTVVATAGTAAAAAEAIEEHRPDLVLLDPHLPDIDQGLALVAEIRARHPGLRVLVMGWSEMLESAARTTGAHAFVPKSASPADLVEILSTSGGDTR